MADIYNEAYGAKTLHDEKDSRGRKAASMKDTVLALVKAIRKDEYIYLQAEEDPTIKEEIRAWLQELRWHSIGKGLTDAEIEEIVNARF